MTKNNEQIIIDELYGEINVLNTANGALNNLVAELEQKLASKEQECEELKFYIESYRQTWELDKYKQTLEEIREIAGQLYYQAIKDPVKREVAIYKIINKINEVKDDKSNN